MWRASGSGSCGGGSSRSRPQPGRFFAAAVDCLRTAVWFGAVLAVAGGVDVSAAEKPAPGAHVEKGRRLFERVWEVGTSPTNDRDGLGPVFNERSCVACHDRGGVGGGGLNVKNVELIAVFVPPDALQEHKDLNPIRGRMPVIAPKLMKIQGAAGTLHADLVGKGGTLLHTFGTDPAYAGFREHVLKLSPPELPENPKEGEPAATSRWPDDVPVRRIEHEGVTLLLTRRNASAMFGAGLIDTVTTDELMAVASEQARVGAKEEAQVAAEQRKRSTTAKQVKGYTQFGAQAAGSNEFDDWQPVTGRVVGRFGWRGQTPTLAAFVKGACVVEMGLEVPGEAPAANPVKTSRYFQEQYQGKPPEEPKPTKGIYDLSAPGAEDLVRFVATLPAPQQRVPEDKEQAAAVLQGEALFQSTGCTVCHRKTMGKATGLYSDLLAHDMGARLDDPNPGPISRTTSERFVLVPGTGGTYYHSPPLYETLDLTERTREWRTPPLWGVADSAPYLHDGRAPTLDAAILLHGGEAAKSVKAYRALTDDDRARVLAFLNSLKAPEPLAPLRPEGAAPEIAGPAVVAGKTTN